MFSGTYLQQNPIGSLSEVVRKICHAFKSPQHYNTSHLLVHLNIGDVLVVPSITVIEYSEDAAVG
jgi:hypothetical protein